MNVPFVNLGAQYAELREEIDRAMSGVIEASDFILGQELTRFEEEFAAYCGTAHAVGLDSGISALELGLRALDVGPGDEVITAANSFIASASPISMVGARPVLVDVDPVTYNIDAEAVERAITSRTKAIIPVHLYGLPADMAAIVDVARRHDLRVIEDACQAHGARYRGRRVGSFGDVAAFSFYPAKNLGAFGDGGMLVTSQASIAEKVRALRNYGQTVKYHHETVAYNRRLDTLQAAVLRVKLARLDEWNGRRRRSAARYTKILGVRGVITPTVPTGAEHVYHLYVIRVPDRDGLRQRLTERGISTGIHYPIPIHLQRAYRDLGYQPGDFPVTESHAQQILSLPMDAHLGDEQIDYVASLIAELAPVVV